MIAPIDHSEIIGIIRNVVANVFAVLIPPTAELQDRARAVSAILICHRDLSARGRFAALSPPGRIPPAVRIAYLFRRVLSTARPAPLPRCARRR